MIADAFPPSPGPVRLRRLAAALLCGTLLACGPEDVPPRQVGTSLPTISYKYRGDQALIEAQRTAATYCDRYKAVPRAARFVNGFIGESVVVFECVRANAPPVAIWHRNQAFVFGTPSDDGFDEPHGPDVRMVGRCGTGDCPDE